MSGHRPRVAIAHDYLTQRGGAERVVLAMSRAFPDAVIHTTLYEPESTYPEFKERTVVTSRLNRIGPIRRSHRLGLPLLAIAASSMTVDADVVLVSSSGWAHGFGRTGHSLVYCYSPARWIYQSDTYLGRPALRSLKGVALLALRPALRRWDAAAARGADDYVAISRTVQVRIRETYGIEAPVLPAPHSMDAHGSQDPVPALEDWADEGYHLVVSRLLPYKNVGVVVEAVRGTDHRLVVVGSGPGRGERWPRSPKRAARLGADRRPAPLGLRAQPGARRTELRGLRALPPGGRRVRTPEPDPAGRGVPRHGGGGRHGPARRRASTRAPPGRPRRRPSCTPGTPAPSARTRSASPRWGSQHACTPRSTTSSPRG